MAAVSLQPRFHQAGSGQGAGAAAQSRVGGRRGGWDVAGASDPRLLRLGDIGGCWEGGGLWHLLGGWEAAPPCLSLSHRAMAGQGQTPPVGHYWGRIMHLSTF